MAYKSLIDYYGGGMVKPSDGYQLGGLVAGAKRQRDYSGELRNIQELAEQSAARKAKAQRKGGLLKTAFGFGGTLLGGPMGSAIGSALGQHIGEKSYTSTDFGGGKYAQDVRGMLGKQEKAYKDQGLARVGLAGLSGYGAGKAGGMFGKAAGGIKGFGSDVGMIKEAMKGEGGASFLEAAKGVGWDIPSVFGGEASEVGKSLMAATAPKVASAAQAAPAQAIAPEKGTYESYKNIFSKRGQDVPLGREQYLESSEKLKALQQPTPDWSGIEQDRLAAVRSAGEAYSKRKEQYDPSSDIPAMGIDINQAAGAGEPLTQSSVNMLYPEWSTQSTVPPSLLSGMSDSQIGQASPWMDSSSEVQTAGGYTGGNEGGFGRGLMNMLMPSRTMPRIGYQSGGQVGYGTATSPEEALRQMGMGDVADDPRLGKYMEDLPQFTMGYKQQLGDITSGARSSLMDISQQGRMQQAGSGFAGGGSGAMGQSRAREGLQRQFGTQKRGLVEGYQADLLSAIADIEGKGGFEFGEDRSRAEWQQDAPVNDAGWNPPSGTEGATYNYNGANWVFSGGSWMTEEEQEQEALYAQQSDQDYGP